MTLSERDGKRCQQADYVQSCLRPAVTSEKLLAHTVYTAAPLSYNRRRPARFVRYEQTWERMSEMSERTTFVRLVTVTTLFIALAVGRPTVTHASAFQAPQVRLVHASPDAPSMDLLVNGTVILSDLEYGSISEYAATSMGTYQVQVVPAGTAGPALIDESLTFGSGESYTIAATDVMTSITPILIEDDNTIPSLGQARVRFMHLSPDAPAVDIAVAGGPVLFANVAFGTVSDYVTVRGGAYDLQVRLAGTMMVVMTLPGVQLASDAVHTVCAIGLVAGNPPLAAVSAVDAGMARLRIVNGSPDAPAIDVWLNGTIVVSNLPFGEASPYVPVAGGEHLFELVASGTTFPVLVSERLTFAPVTAYTIAATDALAAITPVVYLDDNAAPPDGQAKVRLMHLSPDAPAVDVAVSGGPALFDNVAFQDASGYQAVDAGIPLGQPPLEALFSVDARHVFPAYLPAIHGPSS